MCRYSENVIRIYRGNVGIRDGDNEFLVPIYEVSVKKIVEIKHALNLTTISKNIGDSFLRPHFILGSCVDGVEGSKSLTLSLEDGLRII